MTTPSQLAADEAAVIRQLRALRRDGGGSGYGEIRIPVADDRVQVIEVTTKVKVDTVKPRR